jgi:hypothetical protein
MESNGTIAETPEQLRDMNVELQRSARQTERTAASIADTARAMLHDGGLALLGLGDLAVRTVRDMPWLTAQLAAIAAGAVRAAPGLLAAGATGLLRRGYVVAVQVQHEPAVRSALRRTDEARRRTRVAARSIARAAQAQAAGVERSVAVLGRKRRDRYRRMTTAELRDLAMRRGIDGRSRMTKAELVACLSE